MGAFGARIFKRSCADDGRGEGVHAEGHLVACGACLVQRLSVPAPPFAIHGRERQSPGTENNELPRLWRKAAFDVPFDFGIGAYEAANLGHLGPSG
jgi:hypothetical protein